jgi:hypothetical protein
MNAPIDQRHFNSCRNWQLYFDNELRDVGGKAPPFIPGQVDLDYARETCRSLKREFLPQNHPLYAVQWRGLPNDAFKTLVPQLVDACKKEAYNPNTVPLGEFREIVKTLPNGYKEHTFVGRECFVKRMGERFIRGHGTIRNPSTHPAWFMNSPSRRAEWAA